MSEENNDSALHENKQVPERGAAPGTMLVSILLLIAGLLLTSALLIDRTLARNGGGLAPSLAKAKKSFSVEKSSPAATAPSPAPQAETSKPGEKGWFGFSLGKKKKESKVRWPRLKLSGLGKPASGETGFAIINGEQVDEGAEIDGAT